MLKKIICFFFKNLFFFIIYKFDPHAKQKKNFFFRSTLLNIYLYINKWSAWRDESAYSSAYTRASRSVFQVSSWKFAYVLSTQRNFSFVETTDIGQQ